MDREKQLLKFCSPTAHAIQNLEQGQIFCQHYAAYNDPFEFWTRVLVGIPDAEREPDRYLAALRTWGFFCDTVAEARADEVIQESVGEYFDECQNYVPPFDAMRQDVRIACFGSERDNLLMWSHYADGLRGFCVVFDEEKLATHKGDYVLDVVYTSAPPVVDSFIYGIAWDQDWYSHVAIEETTKRLRYEGKKEPFVEISMHEQSGEEALRTMREIWQQVFATKPVEWQYERERRLLMQTDRTDTAPILRPFGRECVRELIIGERMPADFRNRLLALMIEHYPEARIMTARRAEGAYTLTFV
ncbi:MAG TPA: DUF2971 domain-containing protein [Novosphingobium sp.]